MAQGRPEAPSANSRTRSTISERVFPQLMIWTTPSGRLGQTMPMTYDYSSSVGLGICILPSPTSGHMSKSTILVSVKSSRSTCLICLFSVLYDICHYHNIRGLDRALASHNCLNLNDMPNVGRVGVG